MPDDHPNVELLEGQPEAEPRPVALVGNGRRQSHRVAGLVTPGQHGRRVSDEPAIAIQTHPTVNIETTQADPRGTQFVCNVIISNKGSVPIDIVKVISRVPPGVALEDGVDSETVRYDHESKRLCSSLTRLCKSLEESGYLAIHKKGGENIDLTIDGYVEAQSVYDRILKKLKDEEGKRPDGQKPSTALMHIISVYEVRLKGLKELNEKKELSLEKGGILEVISPQSSFSRMYMFRGKRDFLTPQSYTVSFECVYRNMRLAEDGIKIPDFTCFKSVTITITPHPAVLSLLAVISSVGGLIVANAVNKTYDTLPELIFSVIGPNLLVAIISAFIFFNAYEHTEMGKKLEAAIGWRSATFIGFITGLLNEKILKAIMALAGGST